MNADIVVRKMEEFVVVRRRRRIETSTDNIEKTLLESRTTGGLGVEVSDLTIGRARKWTKNSKILLLVEP